MEGVLLVSSTGFAPGSIYGSTFALRTTEFWLPTIPPPLVTSLVCLPWLGFRPVGTDGLLGLHVVLLS